jgi:TonB family protein
MGLSFVLPAKSIAQTQQSVSEQQYLKDVKRRLQRNWQPPVGVECQKPVEVDFWLTQTGMLKTCKVSKSSGNKNFDKSAMYAVEISAPFKPIPIEWNLDTLEIKYTFSVETVEPN